MIGITAQVSLYPLRQESLSPVIDEALRTFRKHGLDIEPGVMSTLIIGDDTTIFDALEAVFHRVAEQGQVVMVVAFSNACKMSSRAGQEDTVTYRAIGYVENDFEEPAELDEMRMTESRIVLNSDLTDGLRGLEPGQQVMVVFYFHRSQGYDLCQHPRGDQSRPQRGVFALRSPRRPNPIGVTEVELMAVERNVLRVRWLDAINGTPVLDLKLV
jgi:tRNA-Thr(GGU) m(6)t(6)A37 methyltransferase TsaA